MQEIESVFTSYPNGAFPGTYISLARSRQCKRGESGSFPLILSSYLGLRMTLMWQAGSFIQVICIRGLRATLGQPLRFQSTVDLSLALGCVPRAPNQNTEYPVRTESRNLRN